MKNLNAKNILILEDHAILRRSLEELLSNMYQVRTARSPSIALELIKESIPNLIICDVMLPEQDGFQFIKMLKSNAEYQSIAVIFLTALGDPINQQIGFDSGGLDYINKPFRNADLLARVKAILTHSSNLKDFYERKSVIKTGKQEEIGTLENKFSETMLAYIDANFDNPNIGLADIAKHLNMSVSTLKRWSKKTNGTTVAVLLKKYRLHRAEIMVRQGMASIGEISVRCGFATQQYFSRCFKEEYGMPPLNYQIKHQS